MQWTEPVGKLVVVSEDGAAPARPLIGLTLFRQGNTVATKVERYQQLYGRRRDDLLSEVLPAGEAYDRVLQTGELTEADLAAIVDAAARPRLLVAMDASL
jgi:hypothetical protein